MNRRLLTETIASLDLNVAALERDPMPGLPGWQARCGIVAQSLRALAAELSEELALTADAAPARHLASCVRDEDGVIELCDPDCLVERVAGGLF